MTTPDPALSYVVTLKDVATDLGNRLDRNTEAVHAIQLVLAAVQPVTVQTADHEARIRTLEQFRYLLAGFGITAGGISGWLSTVIIHAIH